MLKINSSDKVSIKRLPDTPGFDGHSLRAYAYFKDQMPDIVEKLSRVSMKGKFYKVTTNNTTEYYYEDDLPEHIKANIKL